MMTILMYYQKFRKILELEGYEFNPYGPCVTNNIIKNKQKKYDFMSTIAKQPTRAPKKLKKIEWLRQEYERISGDGYGAMSVSRGKIHKYLGMTLDYAVSGIARISML